MHFPHFWISGCLTAPVYILAFLDFTPEMTFWGVKFYFLWIYLRRGGRKEVRCVSFLSNDLSSHPCQPGTCWGCPGTTYSKSSGFSLCNHCIDFSIIPQPTNQNSIKATIQGSFGFQLTLFFFPRWSRKYSLESRIDKWVSHSLHILHPNCLGQDTEPKIRKQKMNLNHGTYYELFRSCQKEGCDVTLWAMVSATKPSIHFFKFKIWNFKPSSRFFS